MKVEKKILIVLDTVLTILVAVIGNILAANIPALSLLAIWIIGGIIILTAIIISITLTLWEDKPENGAMRLYANQQAASKSASQASFSPSQSRPSTSLITQPVGVQIGQPTIDYPMLICLAVDVSQSMKEPIVDHTGKTVERWTSVHEALEHFIHLGVSWVKDPETQKVLPLYYLMAYGFGFKELMHALGRRKTPGGPVRDLFAHPVLPSLPSASELSDHWKAYQNNILSQKKYTGDLFGSTPTRQALLVIRDRIQKECKKRPFTFPVLLLIISDGLPDEHEDPLPLIDELHAMGVLTLCCYLADKDILAPRQLYAKEEASWSEGAKNMFRWASPLYQDTHISQAIFDYLADYDWHPCEGVRLFAQVNQAQELENFLEVLLRGTANERRS